MAFRRLRLFEFEDLPWFPGFLRRFMTDYLEFVARLTTLPFEGFAMKLKSTMEVLHQDTIIDLCSGSAGPIPQILKIFREKASFKANVVLTDLYPNQAAFERIQKMSPEISFVGQSVDAARMPPDLQGVRTLFNAFHHFPPETARKILQNAADSGQAIAIYEIVGRSPLEFLGVLGLVVGIPFFTPFIRPFRFSRLLFTYLIPLVPLLTLWDGWISCLRVYSPAELKKMTDSVAVKNYAWDVGIIRFGRTPWRASYLIGLPTR